MQDLIQTCCLGHRFLPLSEPIECCNGASVYGRVLKLYNLFLEDLNKPYVSFILPSRVEVLVDVEALKKALLSDDVIDRILRNRDSERFEDLKETLLVQEISPWDGVARELEAKLKDAIPIGFMDREGLLDRCKRFFNAVVTFRKTQVFTVIKLGDWKDRVIVLGRRGSQGGDFIVSKNTSCNPIEKGTYGEVRSAEVWDLLNFKDWIPNKIALKLLKSCSEEMGPLEKKGHRSVQNLDEGIIEYIGDVIDDQTLTWDPIGSVFPLFSGDVGNYLEKVSLAQESSPHERYQVFMRVFKTLSRVLQKMHERNLVHNDIKIENVLLNWYPTGEKEIQKVVLADFGNTDPLCEALICSPRYTFLEEFLVAKRAVYGGNRNLCREIRKQIDIRQFGFFMYDVLAMEKNEETINQPLAYPDTDFQFDKHWSNPQEFYRELSNKVPHELRNLIRDMLSPDKNKVPKIEEVIQRLELFECSTDKNSDENTR